MRIRGRCTVAGCGRPHLARGFCSAHYKRATKGRGIDPERPIMEKHAKGEGFTISPYGYAMIHFPEHPMAQENGYLLRNRFVMSRKLGRLLSPEEIVHHENENRADDRRSNLELLPTKGAHTRLHHQLDPPPREPNGRLARKHARRVFLL